MYQAPHFQCACFIFCYLTHKNHHVLHQAAKITPLKFLFAPARRRQEAEQSPKLTARFLLKGNTQEGKTMHVQNKKG